MSSYSLILIFNFFPLWTKFGCISESLCLSVRPSICADSCPASNSYGEILYFLLICITAILESVLWIPTQQNILREKLFSNYQAKGNSELFLPHLVLYFTQTRIGMCKFVYKMTWSWWFFLLENTKRSFIKKLWCTVRKGLLMLFWN